MTQFENREFWFARNIPLLAEEGRLRGQSKSREATFCPRRRGGQFGAIFSFAGLTTRPLGNQDASQHFIDVASTPPLRAEPVP